MKIDISEFEKTYTFELEPVTQMCGRNIPRKTYILESIKRYFSTYKYQEEKNKWRDNVKLDGKLVGRKYFSVVSVNGANGAADIISMIKLTKQSIMTEYIKQLMNQFDWQQHLHLIDIELEKMFALMNDEINHLGDIELNYETADVWDMVQKADITGENRTPFEDKNIYDLLMILLNIIEQNMKQTPRKMMIIFENLDHLISKKEYIELMQKTKYLSVNYDICFLITTSLDGYILCEKELYTGIVVIGIEDFQFPEENNLLKFIEDNYPYNKKFDEAKISAIIQNIVQRIGVNDYLIDTEENVICKMINQTLLLKESCETGDNILENAFLKS